MEDVDKSRWTDPTGTHIRISDGVEQKKIAVRKNRLLFGILLCQHDKLMYTTCYEKKNYILTKFSFFFLSNLTSANSNADILIAYLTPGNYR